MQVVARVRYAAPSNEEWGENEIDYIVLLPLDDDVAPTMALNANEVSETKYVSPADMRALMADDDVNVAENKSPADAIRITPWFRLLCDNFLFEQWWPKLEADINAKFEFDNKIHSFYDAEKGEVIKKE